MYFFSFMYVFRFRKNILNGVPYISPSDFVQESSTLSLIVREANFKFWMNWSTLRRLLRFFIMQSTVYWFFIYRFQFRIYKFGIFIYFSSKKQSYFNEQGGEVDFIFKEGQGITIEEIGINSNSVEGEDIAAYRCQEIKSNAKGKIGDFILLICCMIVEGSNIHQNSVN